jgi:Family of unknown function (DUF5995)
LTAARGEGKISRTAARRPVTSLRARSAVPATSIAEVLSRLDAIIDRARRDRNRIGYFAALYRNVTAQVQAGIARGRFEDGPRMEALDVRFANRYLDAHDAWRAGGRASRCWVIAFEATATWPPLILQHLLLGMNAHINLDLGIAAADTCPGPAIRALEHDFVQINALLGEMIDDVQDRIGRVSPWMGILDTIGHRSDEEVCGFCIGQARSLAWATATDLAPLSPVERAARIQALDLAVSALALPIRNPGLWVRSMLLVARAREARQVETIIDALVGDPSGRPTS